MDTRVTGSAAFNLSAWSALHLAHVESALERWVRPDAATDAEGGAPVELIAAMRYAVLDGGKRLRPLLVLAASEAASGERPAAANTPEIALRAACAVELIHAYSLVHDDLPCMDNDVLRRGKATVHVKFGEASAMLAGDALQAMAFELLTPDDDAIPARQQAALCRLLARAAGSAGMAGGQAIDLASVGVALTERQLRQMHRLKTGALLQASVMMGAACGDVSAQAEAALMSYGAAIGLAFQVVDDMLDVTADSATLGKTAGKDADQDKPTFVSLLGLERAGVYAQELLAEALAALARSGLHDTQALQGLARRLVNRTC
ncbi:polyprenyl synthetase family protein [Rhodoferax ferrireducens]|uniref:polyprenyl synthetase family protein n=1 Tax=Rhodoferax ferrireducens TaxID=192843 RepID=UPI00298E0124|nr:farnesyl diphosphate synthase [Rhodoferax ferrireducens]WPC65724.1 polyprenyl synthetase family protein [Rhodoferax ferrireducens]